MSGILSPPWTGVNELGEFHNKQKQRWFQRCRLLGLAGTRILGFGPRMRAQAAWAVGGAASIGAEDQRELAEGGHVVLAPAAKVADPGGKVWHSDQIIADPGVICHTVFVHLTCLALRAGHRKF